MASRSLAPLLGAAVLAVLAPVPAGAAWSTPAEVPDSAGMYATTAPTTGGTVVLYSGSRQAFTVPMTDSGLGKRQEIWPNDPWEQVVATEFAANGDATVLTQRRRPKQKVRTRVVLTTASGVRIGPTTVSDRTRRSSAGTLSVAPDGTSIAVWWEHRPRRGWVPRAATRLPGQAHFSAPTTLSNVAPIRRLAGNNLPIPYLVVAAGNGGRFAVAWGLSTAHLFGEQPPDKLSILSAPDGNLAGAARSEFTRPNISAVGLTFSNNGRLLASFLSDTGTPKTSLLVTSADVGQRLPAPTRIATGDTTGCECRVETAFSKDGQAAIAWTPRSGADSSRGPMIVVTRRSNGSYTPAKTLVPDSADATDPTLRPGPDGKMLLSWSNRNVSPVAREDVGEQFAIRPSGASAFGAPKPMPQQRRTGSLEPVTSLAFTARGDLLAVWPTWAKTSEYGVARYSVLPAAEVQ